MKVQLRIKDKKEKGKKGRPRVKKDQTERKASSSPPKVIPVQPKKNYIVQLKINCSDLENIREYLIVENGQIGYQQPNIPENYDQLLSQLEMPLVLSDNKIPDVHDQLVVPVLPSNVPIKLFDEDNSRELPTDHEANPVFRNQTDVILPLFENEEGFWPKESPYACWNCDCHFDGPPIGLPQREEQGKIYCLGNCCSFGCAGRYLADRVDKSKFWYQYSLLCILYQEAYGLPPTSKAPIAPPPESLAKKGGKLTYEQYHQINPESHVEVYQLPLVPVYLRIQEVSKMTDLSNLANLPQVKIPKVNQANLNIPIDPERLKQAEDNLKKINRKGM